MGGGPGPLPAWRRARFLLLPLPLLLLLLLLRDRGGCLLPLRGGGITGLCVVWLLLVLQLFLVLYDEIDGSSLFLSHPICLSVGTGTGTVVRGGTPTTNGKAVLHVLRRISRIPHVGTGTRAVYSSYSSYGAIVLLQ